MTSVMGSVSVQAVESACGFGSAEERCAGAGTVHKWAFTPFETGSSGARKPWSPSNGGDCHAGS
jgi:hypothetical protein